MTARWLGLLACLGGCSSVLGTDDYRDAVDELCQCNLQLAFLPSCNDTLHERLRGASEPTRAAWLQFFVDNCTGPAACERALDCYGKDGTCSNISCESSEECCGFSDGASCNVTLGTCEGP